MGSSLSRSTTPITDVEQDALATRSPNQCTCTTPYHGLPAPLEASLTHKDSADWYASFFEQAECVPHRDGKNIIVRWPAEYNDGYGRTGRETTGWPCLKMKRVYQRLRGECRRIVRFEGALSDGSLVLERLWPGPFDLRMPVMTVPVPAQPNRQDSIMLRLYWRWALQGLSALAAVHSHGIYLRTFLPDQIWLRSDFSLALTGFIGADILGDTTDYGEGGVVYPGVMEFDDFNPHPGCGCIEEDLFYWATFVWKLMTNDYTEESPSAATWCWEPCCPVEGGCKPYDENREVFDERYTEGMWQELEEARLGKVLVKAWSRGYDSAEQVVVDIKAIAEKVGIVVMGEDEVEISGEWEDVFEKVEETPRLYHNRTLRFKDTDTSRSE